MLYLHATNIRKGDCQQYVPQELRCHQTPPPNFLSSYERVKLQTCSKLAKLPRRIPAPIATIKWESTCSAECQSNTGMKSAF